MKCSILNLNPERQRVMRKFYFALAVVATAMLVSCEREKDFGNLAPLGKNDIAFVLKGVSTRSSEQDAPNAVPGVSIPMGADEQGNALFLEETIEELNPIPETKGAPAYTVNVGSLYPSMGVYATGDFGDTFFEVMDKYDHMGTPNDPNAPIAADPDAEVGDGWRYHRNYASSPWPEDKTTPVDFYFYMPTDTTGAGVSFKKRQDKKIEFKYKSPYTAAGQKDILFAQTTLSKEQHDGYLPNGAPVLMYHALTGVKFRSGSSNDGSTKTIITKVEFQNLKDNGTCVIDMTANEKVQWDPEKLGMTLGTFSQEFENPTYTPAQGANNIDGTVGSGNGYDANHKWNSDLAGTSWTSAAAENNLNKKDGSLTFWFIPQTITKDVVLKVTFCVKTPDTPNGTEITHTIKDFGTKLENVEWKAGQLRTYTLNPKDVDVEIFDNMQGLVKSNLHVGNTGNVDEYVRMLVIGNWYGWLPGENTTTVEPSILVGYKYEDAADAAAHGGKVDDMVDAWYRENATYSTGFDAGLETKTFVGGKPVANVNKWVQGTGSYFYYPQVIGAGKTLPSGTDALFQNYTLNGDWVPDIWVPSADGGRQKAVGVHLVMECVIQAIGAGKPDGSGNYRTCWEAWSAATGETIEEKK